MYNMFEELVMAVNDGEMTIEEANEIVEEILGA